MNRRFLMMPPTWGRTSATRKADVRPGNSVVIGHTLRLHRHYCHLGGAPFRRACALFRFSATADDKADEKNTNGGKERFSMFDLHATPHLLFRESQLFTIQDILYSK